MTDRSASDLPAQPDPSGVKASESPSAGVLAKGTDPAAWPPESGVANKLPQSGEPDAHANPDATGERASAQGHEGLASDPVRVDAQSAKSLEQDETLDTGATDEEAMQTEDRFFIDQLRAAELLSDLDTDEPTSLMQEAREAPGPGRRITLAWLYYHANGDQERSLARRRSDRCFTYSDGEPVTAAQLVQRLAEINTELVGVKLERIGNDEGPLVLRSGEHVAGIVDDYDDLLDTDEIDLRDLEPEGKTISVAGLVHAFNVLLEKEGVRERLVALESDEERELYVGVTLSGALTLCREKLLEEEDPEELMEHAGW
ncbi:MAG: hypothetical protein AAGF12_24490 [Myxococcota bacterium]